MNRSRSAVTTVTTVIVLLLTTAGCGAAKDRIVNDALEDSGVEVKDLGKSLPDDFPSDVPVPTEGVDLETAIDTGGMFVMRYSLTDAAVASAGYRAELEAAGFTIGSDFDNLDGDAKNIGFTATSASWEVTSVAFGAGELDGLYMGVSVEPVT